MSGGFYNPQDQLSQDQLSFTTSTDPALNAATSTANIDNYAGVVITLTGAGNAQTLQSPTATWMDKRFTVANDDSSTDPISINGEDVDPGNALAFVWDGDAWVLGGGGGDITGSGSSTDNAIARWDGATGDALDTSLVYILDSGKLGLGIIAPISTLHVYENTALADTTIGLTIEQNGVGDAVTQYLLTGGQRWVTGIDNSDSDKFKIASSADLNSNAVFNLTTGGLATFISTLDAATGNQAAITINYTANKATSGNDTGIEVNQTDTLSPGTSYLINLRSASANKFNVTNTGATNWANNAWLSATDNAGTGTVNMIKVNASDQIELGGALSIGDTIQLVEDGGLIRLVNQNVTSSAADGTAEGYTFAIDNTDILKVRASSNGAGGVDEKQVVIAPTLQNDATKPSLAFGDGDTGFYESVDDNLTFSRGGTAQWQFAANNFQGLIDGSASLRNGASGATTTTYTFKGDADTGIGSAAADQLDLIVGGVNAIHIEENTTTRIGIGVTTTPSYEFTINSQGTDTCFGIDQDQILAAGESSIYVASTVAQTTGSAIARIRDTHASTTIPILKIERADANVTSKLATFTDVTGVEQFGVSAIGAVYAKSGITPRVVTTTDDATAVIDVTITDVYELSAIANATEFTLTGTPVDGQKLIIRLKDAGASKALTWTGFTTIGVTLPAATTISKWHYVGCTYNLAATAWHAIAVTEEA